MLVENENQIVRTLVTEVVRPEEFAALPLDDKRILQVVVVVRHLLRSGDAHGIAAVDPAVTICKKSQVGTGWFMGQKISHMLARALIGRTAGAFSEQARSTDTLVWACNRIIEAIVPTARLGEMYGEEEHLDGE